MKIIFFICLLFQTISLFSFSDNTALAVETIYAYKKPSIQGKQVFTMQLGELCIIIEKSKKTQKFNPQREFSYHWYKIKYKNKIGWAPGQFLYKYYWRESKRKPIRYNKKNLELLIFQEEIHSEGMPSQSTYRVPVIYDNKHKKLYPIYNNPEICLSGLKHSRGNSRHAQLLMMISNTGFYETPEKFYTMKIPVEGGRSTIVSLVLKIGVAHQVGGSSFSLELTDMRDHFMVNMLRKER